MFFVQAETHLEDVCLNKICPDPDKRRIGDLASGEVILFYKELFPCGEKMESYRRVYQENSRPVKIFNLFDFPQSKSLVIQREHQRPPTQTGSFLLILFI